MISLIIPSWQRPLRTRRAIECCLNQTYTDWELLLVGDCCPVVQQIKENNEYPDSRIKIFNMPQHEGDYGTQCIHWGIENSSKPYLCFMGNDDIILPEHLETRFNSIVNTEYDFVYHDAFVDIPYGNGQYYREIRHASIDFGSIGNSEIVYKTEFLRQCGAIYGGGYGHDWWYIVQLVDKGAKYTHYPSTTYIVKSRPGSGNSDIID